METLTTRLPESIKSESLWLFACDAIVGVIAIVLYELAIGSAGGAFLMITSALLVALAIGRYRISLAATATEEWYAALSVSLLALPIAIGFSLAFEIGWYAPIPAFVIWTIGAGYSSAILTKLRRRHHALELAVEDGVDVRRVTRRVAEQTVVRALDITFASIASVLALPIVAVIAVLIAREDGTPVIFSQTRVGRDERDFTLYKFRTMKHEAGEEWVVQGDARLTKSGAFLRRTSLDELPQLWNVLRGDMSLVGPRPEMRSYADGFSDRYAQYSNRHLLRPGLTGWAQMRLPRNLQPSDAPNVLAYDLFYVAHSSVYLYMFCLLKTACELSSHHGA